MTYQVLARKWRPQNFEELVGQEKVLAALVHSLTENRLHHAYLFTGTRGVGKTTVARILAKSLNCEQGISAIPCEKCQTCLEIREGRYIDLIEIDAASRTKVEDTRELLENIQYAPAKGRFKVYLIDEVHMLSTHSFNALLKTLEEPPEHVKFLLATTDPQKLPITVLSRCLQFHLKNIPIPLIIERLIFILNQEKVSFDQEALFIIAKAAEGSLRDALSLTDQAIGQGEGAINLSSTLHMLGLISTSLLYQLCQAIVTQNSQALFSLLEKIGEEPVDYSALLKLMTELWYEVSLQQTLNDYISNSWDNALLKNFAHSLSPTLTQLFYEMALSGRQALPFAPDPKVGFNMTLLRMFAFRPIEIKNENLTDQNSALSIQNSTSNPIHAQPQINPRPSIPTLQQQTKALAEPNIPVPQELRVTTEKIPPHQWDQLLEALSLTGMVKQLVKHTHFDHIENNTLFLNMTSQHQGLFNDKAQAKLIEALNHYYNNSFSLKILITDASLVTPASQAEEIGHTREKKLEEKLNEDPNIDFIKNQFNAKISSIIANET